MSVISSVYRVAAEVVRATVSAAFCHEKLFIHDGYFQWQFLCRTFDG
jgi:hypothetical protein